MLSVGDFYRLLGTQVHPQTSVCFQFDSLVVHSSSTGARSGQESQSWPSCGNMKLEGTSPIPGVCHPWTWLLYCVISSFLTPLFSHCSHICSLAVIYGHEGSRRKGEVLTWQDPRVKRLVKTSPLVYWHESDSWPALPVLSSGPPHGDNVWCFILEYSSRLTGRIWVILISSVLLLLGIEKGPKNQDT